MLDSNDHVQAPDPTPTATPSAAVVQPDPDDHVHAPDPSPEGLKRSPDGVFIAHADHEAAIESLRARFNEAWAELLAARDRAEQDLARAREVGRAAEHDLAAVRAELRNALEQLGAARAEIAAI